MNVNLHNCTLVDGRKVSIAIREGKINEISETVSVFDQEIDIGGKMVIPGIIDTHVHFREPGGEQKEDWSTGSEAAAAGGVTTVIDMPNTDPPTIDSKTLEKKRKLAEKSLVNYGFFLGATKDNLKEIKKARNIAGVKVYVGSSTGNLLVSEDDDLENLFTIPNIQWVIHAEDEPIILQNQIKFSSDDSPSVHSKIRERSAAIKAVERIIVLSKKTGARIHICHVSTQEEVELIQEAKGEGVFITCEVSPHHLFLTDQYYFQRGNFAKVNPPLRTVEDTKKLFEALEMGIIDTIATDHAPHTIQEKEQEYSKAPSGLPEVQTSLPLMLNEVSKGTISLQRVVEIMSEKPAKRFHIQNKGKIAEGYDADLTVIDLNKKQKVAQGMLRSKCGWSPYEGQEITGWPIMTFVNGNLIFNNKTINKEYKGKEVIYE
ncbi:dihydroorotase [Patescibacteria group bacterium]